MQFIYSLNYWNICTFQYITISFSYSLLFKNVSRFYCVTVVFLYSLPNYSVTELISILTRFYFHYITLLHCASLLITLLNVAVITLLLRFITHHITINCSLSLHYYGVSFFNILLLNVSIHYITTELIS